MLCYKCEIECTCVNSSTYIHGLYNIRSSWPLLFYAVLYSHTWHLGALLRGLLVKSSTSFLTNYAPPSNWTATERDMHHLWYQILYAQHTYERPTQTEPKLNIETANGRSANQLVDAARVGGRGYVLEANKICVWHTKNVCIHKFYYLE